MITQILRADARVISVIGSGGKTSLILVLAREFAEQGKTVLITTTTHIQALVPDASATSRSLVHAVVAPLLSLDQLLVEPAGPDIQHFDHNTDFARSGASSSPDTDCNALDENPVAPDTCYTTAVSAQSSEQLLSVLKQKLDTYRIVQFCKELPDGGGRLCAPSIPLAKLKELADIILVEADGSRHLPLKAHKAFEPVIDSASDQTILVVSASGFDQPIEAAVHRSDVFCQIINDARSRISPRKAREHAQAQAQPYMPQSPRAQACPLNLLTPQDLATPELVAEVIAHEKLSNLIFISQADLPEVDVSAQRFYRKLCALAPHTLVYKVSSKNRTIAAVAQ